MTDEKSKLDKTLEDRGASYGRFADNSRVAIDIKLICWHRLRGSSKFHELSEDDNSVILNAIDMIAAKISRLVTGDPLHKDSWQDISGYAELVVRHIEEAERGE